jgi:assimilatory nitrate reductase catalytic subunit
MSSAAAAASRAFGIDRGLPFPLPDVAEADVIVLAGSNAAETMPPFTRWLADQEAGGGALIVIDPRRTPTARRAALHLQVTPGTDPALALRRAAGRGGVLAGAGGADNRGDRRRAACRGPVARGRPAGDGAHRTRCRTAQQGVDTVSAFINLALAFGLPGTPGRGYGCLTGQGNGQGGREHGQKADQLRARALLAMGSNVAVSSPGAGWIGRRADRPPAGRSGLPRGL